MKKILLLILLLLPLGIKAQMTRTDSIGVVAFGMKVNFIHFSPKEPSDLYVIFLHGIGERGPVDGSKLSLVLKNGWPKHAQAGFEFPFHLIVPQCESSYNQIKYHMPSFVKLRYNAKVIFVTGLSMGGFGTADTKINDNLKQVDGFAVVCGGISSSLAPTFPEVTAWFLHGDIDTTVPYIKSKAFVDKYNQTHSTKILYTLYPNTGHNAWDKAYSVTPGSDQLLQWFKVKMGEASDKKEVIKKFNFTQFQTDIDSLIWKYRQSQN